MNNINVKPEDLKTINDFVIAYRNKYQITPGSKPLFELSSFANNDGNNILYRHLIHSHDWNVLKGNQSVVDLVLKQIEKDRVVYGL